MIDMSDPCPCDSGRRARGCCLFGGRALVREATTRPPTPSTGYANPKCYAAELEDCSPKVTGEHFLSRGVLTELAGRAVWVRGFPWQRTEAQRVGVGSLESKVLCERHNNVLAPLDAQGVRLFRALAAIGRELDGDVCAPRVKLFSGADVERWLLKVLLGLASSGSARAIDGAPLPWSPPAEWCRTLFGQRPFAATWGLYVTGTLGDGIRLNAGEVTFAPLRTDEAISGLTIALAGVRLNLVMRDVGPRRTGALDDQSIRHPNELLFTDAARAIERSICFTWARNLEGGQITFGWRPAPAAT